MNIIDAVIILFLLLGAVVGFKQCVLKKTVNLKTSFTKLMFKPFVASIMMAIVSYGAYLLLNSIALRMFPTLTQN